MKPTTRTMNILLAGVVLPLLAGCGAQDIGSPGTGGVTINYPAEPTPTPTPTPTPVATVTPAAGCPSVPAGANPFVDAGVTESTPTGSWRVCQLPSVVNASMTLAKIPGLLYSMNGRVDVGCDRGPAEGSPTSGCTLSAVTLTVDPGVIVFGNTGVSWLAVNRGNKIQAVGTAAAPIIFTSRDNVLGLNNANSSMQWGGVVLLGRAKITDCATSATPGTVDCYRDTEGAATAAYFGGATDTDNSGRMSYVQIRYSGYVLGSNSELQALTLGGVGSGTQFDHIQLHNSSDDGMEAFGGNVNMKHLIIDGAEDDSIDTDTGVKANLQFVIAAQRTNVGDLIIEADTDNVNDANTPRQNTKIANATFLANSTLNSSQAAILIRGGADYAIANSVLVAPNSSCLRISRAQTASTTVDSSIDEAGAPIFRSFQMKCGGSAAFVGSSGVTATEVQAIFEAGTNNSATYTPSLTNAFVNGATETAVPASDVTTLSSFFTATNYIGAVKDANDTWYAGWTCNSSVLTFDNASNANRACTSLPIS